MSVENFRPRAVLVAPVFPFRGGIAQHTTYVARELDKICDLHTISFKRQYPKFLYPGVSDHDPDSPEPGLTSLEYTIDSINPLTWLSAIRRIRALKPAMVIIPWWTFFLGPCLGTIARGCRRAGIDVRIICHNADEHEAAWWKGAISRWVLRSANAMVAQSRPDRDNLRQNHPNTRISAFPHPIQSEFPDPTESLPRRAAIELLFFGLVRPYKGLDVLINALPGLNDLDWHLSIVGEFWSGREETAQLIKQLGIENHIEIVDSYVSDEVAANFVSRADMVITPYRTATGSGVIPLAYRYGKPVVATRVGGLSDVVDDGQTGYLVKPDSPDDIAQAIKRLVASDHDFVTSINQMKSKVSWARFAQHLAAEDFESDIVFGQIVPGQACRKTAKQET